MWMKEMFVFFMSLALGYILCVIAKKQTSILKTLGYTLGISIMVLTFAYALVAAQVSSCFGGKPCPMGGKMMKCMTMMKHHK